MRFIKKYKYKLLTLMLSIVSIFTLFLGINKTYAYETDTFSYTISSITLNSNTSSIFSYDTDTHVIKKDGTGATQVILNINLPQQIDVNKCYLLINADIEVSSDDIDYSTYYNTATQYASVYRSPSNNGSNYSLQSGTFKYTSGIKNNNMYTIIAQPNTSITQSNYSTVYLWLSCFNGISQQYAKFTIKNIDYVMNTDIGLSQYYETYYSQIEDNYNALLSDYNDLQDDYDTLEGNYNTLQDNYDTLENNYNQLNGNINNLNDFYNYGFIAFMKNGYTDSNDNVYSTHFTIYYADRNTNTFLSKEYPLTLNDVVSYFGGSSLSLYELSNYYIDLLKNSITNFTDLYYISECNLYIELQSLFNIEYIDFINNDFTYDMELFIRNSVDNIGVYFNALDTTNTNINSTKILEKNSNLKQFNSIEFDRISYDSDLHEPFITLNNVSSAYYNNGFNNGYQSGLQQGKDSQQTIINDLNNQITILTSRVTNLEYLNQALNEQINSFNTDYNLNNLMWTIASTPFDSFKQIWNVNFFGVNISSVITGFLTGIIVLWIIKKFFL